VPSLTDGQNSLLVPMRTNPKDHQHGFVAGIFTDVQTGKAQNASLLIDLDTLEATGVWLIQDTGNGGQAIAEALPQAGDTFEPSFELVDQKGIQFVASGTKFTFGKNPLKINYVPAPDGQYALILIVTDAANNQACEECGSRYNVAGLQRPELWRTVPLPLGVDRG
jgi:hypothetical protein